MKVRQFLWNTLILTIGSVILRLIGVSFNVYLSNKIGAEGMGLFQLVFVVYGMASTVATSGIYLAVTRLVAEGIGVGSYAAANDAMKKCMTYGVIVSSVASAALFCFAKPIGVTVLQDARAVPSLRILAAALPFMAFSSSLRGYFFAIRNVVKSTSSQILEQLIRIVIVTAGLVVAAPKGMTYACCAIALGSVGGEGLAFCYTLFLYLQDRRRHQFIPRRERGTTKKVLSITIPVALSSYLKSALVTIENILIPRGFKKYGASGSGALAQYGMMEGMVMPILTFPAAFLTSFSSLLVPEIAEARARGNFHQINRLASKVFQLTMLFSIPLTALFLCFSHELGEAIYQSEEAGDLLTLLAPLVPLMYLDNVADAMLKGMDEQVSVLRYSIADSSVSVLLIWTLIPLWGVNGYICVLFVSTFVNASLSINRMMQVTEITISPMDWIVKPLFCILISAGAVLQFGKDLSFATPVGGLVVRCLLLFIGYFLLLLTTRAVTVGELRRFFSRLKPEIRHPSSSTSSLSGRIHARLHQE